MEQGEIPAAVHEAFAAHWGPAPAIRAVPDGLVNRTWAVGDPPAFALQCLAPLFDAADNARSAEAAALLAAAGLPTPRHLPTAEGAPGLIAADGRVWRLTPWLAGRTRHRLDVPAQARSAAALLARFHRILAAAPATARWPVSRFHDTEQRMADLVASREASGDDDMRALADAILTCWRKEVAPLRTSLPARPGHGDPKISNFLFTGDEAVAVLDLDTVARQPVDDDLGDALRSWCNPAGEDTAEARLNPDLFESALAGYLPEGGLSDAERSALVPGLARIALELAARFCADAADGHYFAWSPTVAPDARAHNLLRARGQLSLCRSVLEMRRRLEGAIRAQTPG